MRGSRRQRPADGGQVARRRPAGADAGRQPLQVEGLAERLAQVLPQGVLVEQLGDGVEAGVDGRPLGQRREEPFLQAAARPSA